MHRSLAVLVLAATVIPASAFLWGGGCCGAPVIQSCCQSTSWAYAPPQIIGYERIPLYAKVPMPAPPTYVRSRPPTVMVQSSPYYPPPPPPPAPVYPTQSSYYPPAPVDNFAPAPAPLPSSVSSPISSVIPPPQDRYDDGDVIVIETDDSRRRRMSSQRATVQPPPTGYVSQPVAPQGYAGVQPQQPIVGGQIEQGIEVTPDQIASNYQPQQLSNPSSYGSQAASSVQSIASNAAYEATGIAPSARRLRKFKN